MIPKVVRIAFQLREVKDKHDHDIPLKSILEQIRKEMRLSPKPHHRIKSLNSDWLAMEWSAVHGPGMGLRNKDEEGQSLNICYINGVLQCLAHTPPFAPWLLNDHAHGECKLFNSIGEGVNRRPTHVLL